MVNVTQSQVLRARCEHMGEILEAGQCDRMNLAAWFLISEWVCRITTSRAIEHAIGNLELRLDAVTGKHLHDTG